METNQSSSAMTTTRPRPRPSMQQTGAAAAAGRGIEAAEEQARAIICMARRAVEEEAANKAKTRGDGAAGKPSPSLKRSLECFLQGQKNKNKATSSSAATTRRHLETSTASSSSSSSPCN